MLGKVVTFLFVVLLVFCALDAIGVLSPTPACQEDQPCWNCSTMGNGVCGPTPTGGFSIPVLGDALTSN